MTLPDVSERSNKVYEALKKGGYTSEEKMASADVVTKISHPLPKNIVLNCVQELQNKGYVQRKAREKAAGYFVVK